MEMKWHDLTLEGWSPPLSSEEILKTPSQFLEALTKAGFLASILVDYVHKAENQGYLVSITPAEGKGCRTRITINRNGQEKTFTMNSHIQLAIAYLEKG